MKTRIKIEAFLITFLLLNVLSTTVFAGSAVWKISKGNDYFYLGGTIHLLSASDHPLPDEFMRAYSDADTLIFETDVRAAQSPEFQQKVMAAMIFSDGQTLKSSLNKNAYADLEKFLSTRGIPIENFAAFQPWAVTTMITVMEYQRLGLNPQFGVENYFMSQAEKDSKEMQSLETLDQQLSFMMAMGDIDPNVSVNYTLKDLSEMPEFIGMMKKAWRSGDVEVFTQSPSVKQMKNEFPALYKVLIINRNQDWLRQFDNLANNHKKEFVLVGTMHLNDSEGLLNQLRKKGYQVEQL